jgi:protein-arginine kinase activator protein McsA
MNPIEHEVDDPPPACADCDAPGADVWMHRIGRFGKERVIICQACADRFASEYGTNADDEAWDRYCEDGGDAA